MSRAIIYGMYGTLYVRMREGYEGRDKIDGVRPAKHVSLISSHVWTSGPVAEQLFYLYVKSCYR